MAHLAVSSAQSLKLARSSHLDAFGTFDTEFGTFGTLNKIFVH